MYSLSTRFNTISFNTLVALAVVSALNYLSIRFNDHQVGDLSFKVVADEAFLGDNYYNEEVFSFFMDLHADLRPLFNWNTNLIFAYITAEYETKKSSKNIVTIWD